MPAPPIPGQVPGQVDESGGIIEGPPATPEEKEIRKAGWRQFLETLSGELQDPYKSAVWSQLGLNLMKDRAPGQSTSDFVARSVEGGLEAGDTATADQFSRGVQTRQLGQGDRGLDLTARGQELDAAGAAADRAGRAKEGELNRAQSLKELQMKISNDWDLSNVSLKNAFDIAQLNADTQYDISQDRLREAALDHQERMRRLDDAQAAEWVRLNRLVELEDRKFRQEAEGQADEKMHRNKMHALAQRQLDLEASSGGAKAKTDLLRSLVDAEIDASEVENRKFSMDNVRAMYYSLSAITGTDEPERRSAEETKQLVQEELKNGNITLAEAKAILAKGEIPFSDSELEVGGGGERPAKVEGVPIKKAEAFLRQNQNFFNPSRRQDQLGKNYYKEDWEALHEKAKVVYSSLPKDGKLQVRNDLWDFMTQAAEAMQNAEPRPTPKNTSSKLTR